jgi:hypothetical protein
MRIILAFIIGLTLFAQISSADYCDSNANPASLSTLVTTPDSCKTAFSALSNGFTLTEAQANTVCGSCGSTFPAYKQYVDTNYPVCSNYSTLYGFACKKNPSGKYCIGGFSAAYASIEIAQNATSSNTDKTDACKSFDCCGSGFIAFFGSTQQATQLCSARGVTLPAICTNVAASASFSVFLLAVSVMASVVLLAA